MIMMGESIRQIWVKDKKGLGLFRFLPGQSGILSRHVGKSTMWSPTGPTQTGLYKHRKELEA